MESAGARPQTARSNPKAAVPGKQMAERAAKTPFDPARKLHARIKAQAMARGLMTYPMGGAVDGARGDHVLLAPPFIATEADLDRIVERLAAAVDAALAAP